MELSSVTLRVLLLFFPGVLCAMLVDALTVHRERTPVQFLTNAFALGMGSYLSLALLRDAAAAGAHLLRIREPLDVSFFDALLNDHVHIAWGEIVLATMIGVVVASLFAAALNRRLLARVGNRFGVTQRTGQMDVWSFLFNSPKADYFIVRDLTADTTYAGRLEVFSESSQQAELLLKDVEVYRNSTSAKLYEAERVYIAREPTSLVIEPLGANPFNGRLHGA